MMSDALNASNCVVTILVSIDGVWISIWIY
jgi:hypothetical protein